jgi:phosphoglycolate phosphatase
MKRIIWDWNGTLLDDAAPCLAITNDLLKRHNLPPFADLEQYRQVFSFPIRDYYEKMGFDFSKTPFEVLAQEYMNDYNALNDLPLHADAKKVLRLAKEAGYGQAVLSASRQDLLETQIGRYDIWDKLDEVLGIGDIYAHSKEELAGQYGRRHQEDELWFVGDTLHDAQAAQAAGAKCILVAQGHQNKERLKAAHVPIADSLMEAWEMIHAGS